MQDGLVRRTLKAITTFCFRINASATRALWRLRGQRPYELGGACRSCGACCVAPSIQVGWAVWYFPSARSLFLWWQTRVNGLELVERDIPNRVFIFRCRHFDPATRRCDSYASRPGMCRDYPRLLLWQARPEFLPECSHYPVARGARGFAEALEREGLPADKLEQVKKKLFLKE